MSPVRRILILSILPLVLASLAEAKGRREPSEDEGFPDYNKLEYAKPIPKVQDLPPPPPKRIEPASPVIDPANDAPLPAPKAVPAPRNTSEPDFPDEMLDTISSTGPRKTP